MQLYSGVHYNGYVSLKLYSLEIKLFRATIVIIYAEAMSTYSDLSNAKAGQAAAFSQHDGVLLLCHMAVFRLRPTWSPSQRMKSLRASSGSCWAVH